MAFLPVSGQNSNASNWNQVNNMIRQLNNEQTTKTFKQPGGNAVITGKLPYTGGYGTLIYDSVPLPRILLATAPDDGRPGLWITIDDKNVIDELNA